MNMIRKIIVSMMSVLMMAVILTGCASINLTVQNKQDAELEYWSRDSVAAASIRDYVARVTDKNSDSFIPVEDRIAVFDLDGTIIGELYPSYFEYMMFIHRALHDDTYDAPDDMREFAEALEAGVYDGNKPENHERLHAKYAGQAYARMTPDELKEYTRKYMESARHVDGKI